MNDHARKLIEARLEELDLLVEGNEFQWNQAQARVQALTYELRSLNAEREALKAALGV